MATAVSLCCFFGWKVKQVCCDRGLALEMSAFDFFTLSTQILTSIGSV